MIDKRNLQTQIIEKQTQIETIKTENIKFVDEITKDMKYPHCVSMIMFGKTELPCRIFKNYINIYYAIQRYSSFFSS